MSTVTAIAAPPGLPDRFELIPLAQLVESKHNPRRHFDAVKLQELAASVRERGVIEPLVVRQVDAGNRQPMKFEIIAGARRYRAAAVAGLSTVPAIVRQYADGDVLEIFLIENIQRDDLRPLERAAGFRALIDSNPDKHSAESIASRLGMSIAWVWDQLKLIDLIPEAKRLLEDDRISVGHAYLISRLKADDQKRCIDVTEGQRDTYGGLWQGDEAGLPFDAEDPKYKDRKPGKYDGLKPRSIRELEAWIADHIRFDVAHAAKAQPLTFETVAAAVQAAEAKPGRGRKMVSITFESFTQPDARTDDERTYGPSTWKRADGSKKTTRTPFPHNRLVDSPTCEYAVLGVVAAGNHRGEAFDVCIARDRCATHWKKEIDARAKAQKQREAGQGKKAATTERKAADRQARELEQQQAVEKRWSLFLPALRTAVFAAVAKMPATLPKAVLARALKEHQLPPATKPAGLAKALLEQRVRLKFSTFAWHQQENELTSWARLLGVDVKACEPKPAAPAKKAAK